MGMAALGMYAASSYAGIATLRTAMFKMTINKSASISIPCPKCGHKQNQLVSRLRQDPKVPCPQCGTVIAVDGKELDQFMRTLEGLGR